MDIGFAPIGLDMPYRVYVSEDPQGVNGGDVNLYLYASGNPVMYVDPNGQWLVGTVTGGVAGAIGGYASGLISGGSLNSAIAGGFAGGLAGAAAGALVPDPAGGWAGAAAGSVVGGTVGGAVGGAVSSAISGKITTSAILTGAATGAFSGLVAAPGIGLTAIATGGSEFAMALSGATGSIMGDTVAATGLRILQGSSCGK